MKSYFIFQYFTLVLELQLYTMSQTSYTDHKEMTTRPAPQYACFLTIFGTVAAYSIRLMTG